MIIINPSISKNTASTKIIKIIFSFGFTNISSPQESVGIDVETSLKLSTTKSTLLGIIGVQRLRLLVPLVGTATVNYSIKLLLLPMPIWAKGI